MAIIRIEDVRREEFESGRIYETLVGDDAGSTPVRVGIQTSPPAHPNVAHGFRNTGQTPMRSYGVHASPVRITHREGGAD